MEQNSGETIPYAHVILQNNATGKKMTDLTNGKGILKYESVAAGVYTLTISFIGFEDLTQTLTVESLDIDLGVLTLKQGIDLTEVQVTEQILPVQQQGDTTEFNAGAFKTLPDANAEELVEKMPTVVLENGKIQAQGEDVKQVLVDGKRFFGDDPTAALKNLPAEVIQKIQIFDQQSDQSKFTGFDDGETSKTINIVTKTNMRNGKFGKIYAGYSLEENYQAGGNINIFNGDQRTSFIGLSNNINQQNFASDDLLGVLGGNTGGGRRGRRGGRGRGGRGGRGGGVSANDFLVAQQGGITATQAGGVNFSDKWGEKLEIAASYFFNYSENLTEQSTNQQFFDNRTINNLYDEESTIQSTNLNHRFSGQLDYTINERNSLSWRPRLRWQNNRGTETIFGQSIVEQSVQSQTDNNFQADLQALELDSRLLWRHKFAKKRRTFSINLQTGYAPKQGESFLSSENIFGQSLPDTMLVEQNATLDLRSWNADVNLQYTEPIGEKSQLMAFYRASYQREESEKESFDFDESSQEYDLFNRDLSNVFSNDYYTQQLGVGYNYRQKKMRLMFRTNVQRAQLLNEQTFPLANNFDNTIWNILPMASLRYRFSRSENLRVFYRSSTQLPSIEQLQNVLDNSNPLQLNIGNPNLIRAYQHSMVARYSKTMTEKGAIFYTMLRANYTQDHLANSIYFGRGIELSPENLEVADGAQLTQPVNLDGYWSVRSFINYGFPVAAIKSNLNVDFTTNYTRTPGLVNLLLNYTNNTTTGIGLSLSSNISRRVDFTISSRSNYNLVNNTLESGDNNNFLNQNTRLKLNWIFGPDLIFRTTLTHQYYDGLSDDFNQNFLLWNLSIGKKVFKNQRGEISLTVFDLLQQNNSLARTITENYTEDVQTNVLQRYVMLNLKYDLRHFKVQK
ncbi:MAG: outer membrane beta-barrel protein [Saprospiraceae bacterium]